MQGANRHEGRLSQQNEERDQGARQERRSDKEKERGNYAYDASTGKKKNSFDFSKRIE